MSNVVTLPQRQPAPSFSHARPPLRWITRRARRIERFLSQNMMAAEQFTGQPGSTVPLKETVEAFDRLAKGEFDHVPEQAFFLIGGLDDLAKKAESLGAKL